MIIAKLSPGFPGLIVLNQEGLVCYTSVNLFQILGETEIRPGLPLPESLLGWQNGTPWETEINDRRISFTAEFWEGRTLLLVADSHGAYSETATILNAIDEGIHVVNKHGQTVFYNPTMAKMEGMDYNQVINKDVLAMFPSLTPETSTILRVLRTREPSYDQVQTYFNNQGRRITTVNSTIPMWNGRRHSALPLSVYRHHSSGQANQCLSAAGKQHPRQPCGGWVYI